MMMNLTKCFVDFLICFRCNFDSSTHNKFEDVWMDNCDIQYSYRDLYQIEISTSEIVW